MKYAYPTSRALESESLSTRQKLVHSPEVRVMQLEETMRLVWFTAIPQICVALALRFVLTAAEHRTALTVLLIAVSIPATIAMYASKFTKAPTAANVRNGHVVATALAALSGMAWSILPLVFLSSAYATHMATVVATVAGLVSIVYVIGPILSASMLFMTPLVCATFAGLVLGGNVDANVLCVLLLIYAAFTVVCRMLMNAVAVERFVIRIEAREQKETIALLLRDFEENASDWLWQTDVRGRITYAPARFLEASGMRHDEAIGSSFANMLAPSRDGRLSSEAQLLLTAMRAGRPFVDQVIEVEVGGRRIWWRLTGKPVYGPSGLSGYRGVGTDVTQTRIAARRIADLAEKDHLTGLLNRPTFARLIEEERTENRPIQGALLYLDLDHFKSVNDEGGHAAGDLLLKEAAARIVRTVPDSAVCARLSGDEFAVWLPGISGAARECAVALNHVIAAPFQLGERSYSVGVSIGVALAPEHAVTIEDLQTKADMALYHVKENGKNRHHVFDVTIEEALVARRTLEADLAVALSRREFVLHYQPLVGSQTGRILSFEALIRWQSPIRGLVPPGDFIAVAEQCGLIVPIGRWALMQACREATRWPEDISIAVNVSPKQFRTKDFAREVAVALEISGLAPGRLEIEITEGVLLEDAGEVREALSQLRSTGVKVAIDDFGTGFSSLGYIARYSVDKIKIDRSFVQDAHERAESRAVVEAIIALAKALSIRVTAEGVETVRQASFLRSLGCDDQQGFLFGRPQNAEQVPATIAQANGDRNRKGSLEVVTRLLAGHIA